MFDDLTDIGRWTTENDGLEYTVRVPFGHPRLLCGELTVLVICDGRVFTDADRQHAALAVQELRQRLEELVGGVLRQLRVEALGLSAAVKGPMTLILQAGFPRKRTLAIDNEAEETTLFVEWDGDGVTEVWTTADGDR